ncbi:MAG: hypothetical protein II697_05945, partial [Clostridia bacterium]|nr:hypothetical protein [Clostridia bacterium]
VEKTSKATPDKALEASSPQNAKLEAQRQSALSEIKRREYSSGELEATRRSNQELRFRNGEGREMSYDEAHREIVGHVEKSIDALRAAGREISDEQKASILRDIDTTLLAQQTESQRRALGSHGIPHLYGVYERMRDIPDDVLQTGAEQLKQREKASGRISHATKEDMRLALTMSAVYHDEGYLSDIASRGVNNGSFDGLHGIDSAIAFENEHAARYRGAVDGAAIAEVSRAIAQHNPLPSEAAIKEKGEAGAHRREMIERARTEQLTRPDGRGVIASMDPNDSLVRSALLLSDKAGVDADEKLPDVLRQPETARIVVEYYTKQSAGVFRDKAEEESASAQMRQQMKKRVDEASLTEAQKANLKQAIDADISAGSGKFNMPLSGAAIPKDALRYRTVTEADGRRVIKADLVLSHRLLEEEYAGAFPDTPEKGKYEAAGKKLSGAVSDDLGITQSAFEEAQKKAQAQRGSQDTVDVRTEGLKQLANVTVHIETVKKDNPKAERTEFEAVAEQTAARVRDELSKTSLELDRKTQEAFREAMETGEVDSQKILEMCAIAYAADPEECADIASQLAQLENEDDESKKRAGYRTLAQRCSRLRIR